MSGIISIVTSQAEYAVSALVELALAPQGKSLRSPEIARRLDIPAASLEQVMVRLRRHGFVRSYRGASGGYALAHPPEDIVVGQVLGVFLPTRDAKRPGPPDVIVRQVVREQLDGLESTLAVAAGALRLSDLAEQARSRNDAMAYMPGL